MNVTEPMTAGDRDMENPVPDYAFESHGYKYSVDKFGLISQVNPEPFIYDPQYSATYDTPEYRRQSDLLQALRLGFAIAAHGRHPESILDFGYGNGAFMKFAAKHVPKVMGFDVTGVQVEGCKLVDTPFEQAEIVTFHDALEHIPDLSLVEKLNCETVIVSLPWCHYFTQGKLWFDTQYKHRKPNEHLHHFNPKSLANTMYGYGYETIAQSHHEDIVRVSTHGGPNILTMAFRKQ